MFKSWDTKSLRETRNVFIFTARTELVNMFLQSQFPVPPMWNHKRDYCADPRKSTEKTQI